MCPTSNVMTRAVPEMAAHPADHLLTRGLAVTISTDGRTTADTSLDHELAQLTRTFGWTDRHWRAVQDNARDAAFAAPATLRAGDGALTAEGGRRPPAGPALSS